MDINSMKGHNMTSCAARSRPFRAASLSDLAGSSFEDRARISAVRKYCQIKPSVVPLERKLGNHENESGEAGVEPDAGLSALMRSLVFDLDADLAMISLLDDRNQYFLAGASRQNPDSAKLFLESSKWYGCGSVLYHGGLCERTVMMRDSSSVYEELDLAAKDITSTLPFVNGEVARFRHYAGCPVVTPDGLAIGTVFAFSKKPSQGLRQQQKEFLTDTSNSVMKQLSQAVGALEGSRACLFNGAITSLLDTDHLNTQKAKGNSYAAHSDPRRAGCKHPPLILDIYQQAAQLLLQAFELDGCHFQEVVQPGQATRPVKNHDALLAESRRSFAYNDTDVQKIVVGETAVDYLVSLYPQGAVLHMAGETGAGLFVSASGGESPVLAEFANNAIQQAFPDAQQVLFMPLWDTIQNRVVSVAFGSSSSFDRFYTSDTDLSMLSAFCTSSIVQVRRVEGRVLERTKSNFLGSISHEMRSPLHGMLGSLELLTDTTLSDEQLDLIQSADAAGKQLLDTIDKILQFTKISALDSAVDYSIDGPVDADRRRDSDATRSNEIDLLDFCEKIVAEVNQKTHTMALLSPPSTQIKSPAEIHPLVIALDAWPDEARVPMQIDSMFGIILENLLTNSIKYSGIDCCLRAGLRISDANLILTITDCGRGIPQDFLSNHLFVPFSQVDQIEAGTGLGLPLVKRAVDALSGTIDIESNEKLGTKIEVSIPLISLTRETTAAGKQIDSQLRLEHISAPLQAQLFIPPVWSSGVYGERGDRLVDNLVSSLSRNLQGLLPTELRVWEPQGPIPSVIFVRYGDVERFFNTRDETWTNVGIVVIGGAAQPDVPPVQFTNRFGVGSKPMVEITGPLLPTTIREALEKVFDASISPTDLIDKTAALELEADITPIDSKNNSESDTEAKFNGAANNATDSPEGDAHLASSSPSSPKSPSTMLPSQDEPKPTSDKPRLLLVDDNSVNLKLLHKFAQKCGIHDMVLASGGCQAIDMYDEAIREDRKFDICFMDLSMPEVNGFQATAEIRHREAKVDTAESHRLEIVALTGLVSSQDQRAAMAAGVDGYVTKSADIKSVQEVISKWKKPPSISTSVP